MLADKLGGSQFWLLFRKPKSGSRKP